MNKPEVVGSYPTVGSRFSRKVMTVFDIIGKKECRQCGRRLPLDHFYQIKGRKNLHRHCNDCHSFNCHLYYLKNTQKCKDNFLNYYLKHKEKHQATVKKWKKKNKWQSRYSDHKAKCKKRNLPFKLSSKDVKELFASPKICEVSGKLLRYNSKKPKSDSPCLCRKDFTKGYSRKTVQLLSLSETMNRVHHYNRTRKRTK